MKILTSVVANLVKRVSALEAAKTEQEDALLELRAELDAVKEAIKPKKTLNQL